jgi:hypothetical protein
VVKVNGREVVADGPADWWPNQIVRRAGMEGLEFTGIVRAVDRRNALLSRLGSSRSAPEAVCSLSPRAECHGATVLRRQRQSVYELAERYRRDPATASRLRAEADALARAVVRELYNSEGEYAGTWKQRHSDGTLARIRHGWDFMNAGSSLADDLKPDQRKQKRDWFLKNLAKAAPDAIWIVSQDPRDGNNGPHQMEHNGRGAYPAWPFHAAWALRELGFPQDARNLTKQIAPVVRFGAISQGNHPSGRRCRSGWASLAGATMADSVQARNQGKGVGSQLCKAPYGPFRQLTPDPFTQREI